MYENRNHAYYHFVIAGGGPAGLAAAIAAARNGMQVVVLEKGAVAGPMPRGEGLRRRSLIGDLIGEDFWDCCYKTGGDLIFHSPGDQRTIRVRSEEDIYFFEWRQLMDRLAQQAETAGVRVLYNSRVIGPVENEDRICVGLNYRDESGAVRKIFGNAVLACDGHKSLIGRHYGVDYDHLNCPMVKCIAANCPKEIQEDPGLHFFIVGNGDLPYAPNCPPCVLYAFPIGDGRMELGLMLRMMQAKRMQMTVRPVDSRSLIQIWRRLKESYPGFSRFFDGAQIEYECSTALSNARMVHNFIPTRGVVLVGDSAGFIDPFGSSGLYSGMAMATFWVNLLAEQMKDEGYIKYTADRARELWREGRMRSYRRAFKRSEIYRRISHSYGRIGKFEWYIFKHLRTAKRINKRWRRISWLLNNAG